MSAAKKIIISLTCPNCGETLEFSFDDEDEE
mgnify:CR=1 FL=1